LGKTVGDRRLHPGLDRLAIVECRFVSPRLSAYDGRGVQRPVAAGLQDGKVPDQAIDGNTEHKNDDSFGVPR
jgi:hypothetical protein